MTDTWVIIASGPSLTPEDVNYCRDKAKVCVVNDNWRLAPWADVLYAADRDWWEHKRPKKDEFQGEKWTVCPDSAKKYGLNLIDGQHAVGMSDNPEMIHYGGNSGYQACNLIFHRRPKRILLLGFDMQDTGGEKHWFGAHKFPLRNTGSWCSHVKRMDGAALDFKKAGIQVINCSRETALRGYKRGIITDCL